MLLLTKQLEDSFELNVVMTEAHHFFYSQLRVLCLCSITGNGFSGNTLEMK